MLSVVVLDTHNGEEINISDILKEAYMGHKLPIKCLTVVNELGLILQNSKRHMEQFDVFISSLMQKPSELIEFAKNLRREKGDIFIVFIANKQTDIAACVKPSIRPSGILFIPLDKIRIYQFIKAEANISP